MLSDIALEQSLKHYPFTTGFSEHYLAKLASLASELTFKADQLILLAGQQSRQFYLLTSGSVCVEVKTPLYTVCVQVLEPGQAFGWSSILDHHDTLFRVRAREACSAICWEGWQLAAAAEEDPAFGRELYSRLLALVAGRVKATESRLAEFCGISSRAPLSVR